tara:strand:+ start:922 stop:1695 length:774 start_codon:yes stop_codon:yes gene_type:complete
MAQENNYTLANINAAMGIQGSGTPEEQRLAQGLRDQQRTADFLTGSTITPQQNVGKQMNNRINTGAEQYGRISQDREKGALDRAQQLVVQERDFQGRTGLQLSGHEQDLVKGAMGNQYARSMKILGFDQDTATAATRQGYAKEIQGLIQDFTTAEREAKQKYSTTQNQADRDQAMALSKMRNELEKRRIDLGATKQEYDLNSKDSERLLDLLNQQFMLQNESSIFGDSDRLNEVQKQIETIENKNASGFQKILNKFI